MFELNFILSVSEWDATAVRRLTDLQAAGAGAAAAAGAVNQIH